MAEDTTAVKATKGAKTLTVQFELFDNMTTTWFRSGDVIDVVTPFLQMQIDAGLAQVV